MRLLFKMYEDFQDGNSRTLNEVWVLLGGGPWDYIGCMPMNEVLDHTHRRYYSHTAYRGKLKGIFRPQENCSQLQATSPK